MRTGFRKRSRNERRKRVDGRIGYRTWGSPERYILTHLKVRVWGGDGSMGEGKDLVLPDCSQARKRLLRDVGWASDSARAGRELELDRSELKEMERFVRFR